MPSEERHVITWAAPALLAYLIGGALCAAGAAEVDPWLLEAIKPWQRLSAIRCSIEESRGSVFPKPGNDVVVSRSITWLWTAKPDVGYLAIVGGPKIVPNEQALKLPGTASYMNMEYGNNWITRSVAYGAGRLSLLNEESGTLTTRAWPGTGTMIAEESADVVPLRPFEFLTRGSGDTASMVMVPELLRDKAWILKQWQGLNMTVRSADGPRRVLSGTFAPEEGSTIRAEGIEVVLEQDPQTHVPVIVETTQFDASGGGFKLVSSFVYAKHQLADGTPIPVCSSITIPGKVRNHVAAVTACIIDKPIPATEMAIDVSKARRVFDVDTGVTINVDAGAK